MAEDELRQVRIEKLGAVEEKQEVLYPERFERTHTTAEAQELDEGQEGVRVCGRLMFFREFGSLSFLRIQDGYGSVQLSFKKGTIGKPALKEAGKLLDIGDWIGVEGTVWRTNKGELTIDIESYQVLAKGLRPMPEKFHEFGASDPELCWRQRYLDLTMNEKTREIFRVRTELIRAIRRFLDDHRFVEVETPVLQTKPSGATARPFVTHHNSLGIDCYLSIAPETWLKRLVVGGYDRVYEFARCFRNEGMDPSHLQDFTMLEYYVAFWNYEDNMAFTERLIKHVLEEVLGTLTITHGEDEIDFGGDWPRKSFRDLILDDSGIDIDAHPTRETLLGAIREKGLDLGDDVETLGRGNLIDALYKKVSRPRLVQPTFLVEHPIDTSPLARRNDEDPSVADRFQLVVNGWEVVNAYSELVDPLDQRRRLEEQARLKAGGDEEAMFMDEEYLLAMEYGMPPMSGWGMGIDRFCALLTDQTNLRDVVFFPLLKPRNPDATESEEAS